MKILLVEDEPKVSAVIAEGLKEQNYEVDIAHDGMEGKEMFLLNSYDIAILDVNLPYISGFDLCKIIRQHSKHVGILMLTALSTTNDKLQGFEQGADDYLAKPFEFPELIARIKAIYKRSSEHGVPITILHAGDMELNLGNKTAIRAGKKIELTAKEFSLLEYLMRNKNRVVSRTDIAQKVWDISFDTGTNVIDVYINFLRKKIDAGFDKKLLHTAIGMGYILKDE